MTEQELEAAKLARQALAAAFDSNKLTYDHAGVMVAHRAINKLIDEHKPRKKPGEQS